MDLPPPPPVPMQSRISKPNDKIEAPIIACNDNFNLPTGRIRRPSTPNKSSTGVLTSKNVGGGSSGGTLPRKGRDEVKKQGSRIRSASAGRDHKTEMSSRYWTYLFENLERSISEIYEGCEKEENIRQCKEVILILENYTRDFTKLIEWFHLKWNYEKTPPPMRTAPLAWEIRKPSLCLLPHTQAYEKLVGISSTKPKSQKIDQKVDPPRPSSRIGSTPPPTSPLPACAEGMIKKGRATPPLAPSAPLPNNNPANNPVFCVPLNTTTTIDIGLQTDLDEDPDIFYFAGGRTVACQTDSLDEYGPLSPISFKEMPAILVLNTSSSESDFGECDVVAPINSDPVKVVDTELMNVSTTSSSMLLSVSTTSSLTSSDFCATNSNSAAITTNPRPITPIETKSSSTQLSAGVLISDEHQTVTTTEKESAVAKVTTTTTRTSTFAEKAKNGMLRQSQVQAKSVSSYLNKVGTTTTTTGAATATKSTALTTRSNSANNKVTLTSSNIRRTLVSSLKPATATGRTGGGGGSRVTMAPPVIPNYRSNIASRCRTAVNTGQVTGQPETQPQNVKCCPKEKTINKSAVVVPPPLLSSATAAESAAVLSNFKALPPSPSISSAKSGQSSAQGTRDNNSTTTSGVEMGTTTTTVVLPTAATVSFSMKHGGITRSKSMINPFPTSSSSTGGGGGGRLTNKSNGGNNANKGRGGQGLGLIKSSGSFKRLHSNSYISLPDETTYARKTIDADGWETVKTRSNRSKWSSSNSSLGSSNANNQSRNSLDKGTPKKRGDSQTSNKKESSSTCTTEKKGPKDGISVENDKNSKKSNTAGGGDLKSKVTVAKTNGNCGGGGGGGKNKSSGDGPTTTSEDDAALDEAEIKKKEADLDDAMREEELLEEELRQVEKDFERIENDSTTEEGTITDSEHAISPDPEEVVAFEEMDDQFFFVSIDDQESANVEDLPPREPGRILTLREKLMSPAKKCDGAETLKRYEAKLAKAERNREKLLQAKFNRYVELSDRFESLNETTRKLVAERFELIIKAEERRKRAAEKRHEYIKSIQRKGHDEDLKTKEIAFINLLEAQNKRHDYNASVQEVECRLQTLQDERRQKLEERSGKAFSVISRQSRIRKDWQAKLTLLQEKRMKTNERITREKEERAKERSEMAQEKARDREGRISALNAAKQAEKEELQKKIKQKQEETARRHEENMEQIRQKAIELSAPRVQEENAAPSSCRVCTLCNVLIQSGIHEMQHIRSRGHLDAVKKSGDKDKSLQSSTSGCCGGDASGGGGDLSNVVGGGPVDQGFGFKFIADIQTDKIDTKKILPDKNRNRGLKKHSKRLMQKLMESGLEYEKSIREENLESKPNLTTDPKLKGKMRKNILELDRIISLFINNKGTTNLATSMDRIMAEIRKTSVQNVYIKDCIIGMNGLEVALKILQCQAVDLPAKSKIHAIEMIHAFILGSLANGLYILRGTGICTLMNLCAERWSTLIPDDNRWLCSSPLGANNHSLPTDYFIQSVVELLFNVLDYVPDPFKGILKKGSFLTTDEIASIKTRTFDIIGYLVTSGVVDRISVYCSGVRGPVDDQPAVALLLQVFLDFLVLLVYTLQFCWGENPASCILQKKEADGTQLLAALEASELAGAVSMSYSLLLHQGAPTRPRAVDGKADVTGPPPPPGEKTAEVVKSTLCLINALARLDLWALQNVLASEAVSLQFRHIASQLLWQVVPHRQSVLMRRLLTELIMSIGNFIVGNKHNQATIQSGQTPTVLQLLCTLPSEYFTDSRFKQNFIPTLLAATEGCQENREILIQNNVDLKMLDDYLTSEDGKKNVFVKRMIFVTSQQQAHLAGMQQLVATSPGGGGGQNNKGHAKKTKKSGGVKAKPLEESNNVIVTTTPVIIA